MMEPVPKRGAADVTEIHITYLNGPDIGALGMTEDEILDAMIQDDHFLALSGGGDEV